MFDFNSRQKITLSDLLQNDRRLITEQQYRDAVQRQFRIIMPDDPEPELSEQDRHDLQLIEDYERQNPEKKTITGFKIVVHERE